MKPFSSSLTTSPFVFAIPVRFLTVPASCAISLIAPGLKTHDDGSRVIHVSTKSVAVGDNDWS
jgi:hypothetical protein